MASLETLWNRIRGQKGDQAPSLQTQASFGETQVDMVVDGEDGQQMTIQRGSLTATMRLGKDAQKLPPVQVEVVGQWDGHRFRLKGSTGSDKNSS